MKAGNRPQTTDHRPQTTDHGPQTTDHRRQCMLTEERFAAIFEELRMKNAVSVTELVEKLGASESTIRRDLNTLDEMES